MTNQKKNILIVTIRNWMERLVRFIKMSFIFGIEEVKPASKLSDTSDTTNVALYAIGVIAAVGVTEMLIRNRMHKSK